MTVITQDVSKEALVHPEKQTPAQGTENDTRHTSTLRVQLANLDGLDPSGKGFASPLIGNLAEMRLVGWIETLAVPSRADLELRDKLRAAAAGALGIAREWVGFPSTGGDKGLGAEGEDGDDGESGGGFHFLWW